MLFKDKKALSIMIGYVLLIVIAIIISTFVYVWLKSYVPRESIECPEGVSVFIEDIEYVKTWDISQLNLTLKNNGLFDIDGYFIHATDAPNQELATIDLSKYGGGKGGVILFGAKTFKPGESRGTKFDFTNAPFETIYSIEVIPIRFEIIDNKQRLASCGNAKVKETITEGSLVVLSCWNNDEEPHPICNCDDLALIKDNLGGNYELQNDIDFRGCLSSYSTGEGWNPIGRDENRFTGTFDGQGHTITGLFINKGTSYGLGLFGYIENSEIKDVGLENVDITGKTYIGGLAGYAENSNIYNSYTVGTIKAYKDIGGLIGFNTVKNLGSSKIINCSSSVDINAENVLVGGLIGENTAFSEGRIIIENCYATGNILGSNTLGGLVGDHYGEGGNSTINNCYATGNVIKGEKDLEKYYGNSIGGLVGNNKANEGGYVLINNSYATGNIIGIAGVGGLVGKSIPPYDASLGYSVIENSFATGDVSGDDYVGGIIGFLRNEPYTTIKNIYWYNSTGNPYDCFGTTGTWGTCTPVKEISYFYNENNPPMNVWDFVSIWKKVTNNFPNLKWQIY